MDLIKCEKCGTDVLERKAFCPECGSPMVDEETRQHTSEHESYSETMTMTKSSYNLMLADMGLNISESPNTVPEALKKEEETATSPPEPTLSPVAAVGQSTNRGMWVIAAAALFFLIIGIIFVLFVFRPFSA